MKLSVSLSDEDVAFIDEYAAAEGIGSRSAVLHRAIDLLRASQLESAYQAAWAEWAEDETEAWAGALTDGGAAG